MYYKGLNEWHSGFHDWVIRRYPHDTRKQNGFMGGFIFGERGKGKSTYAYKLMGKVYYTTNGFSSKDNEEDAYKESLKHMIYEPKDFQNLTIYNKIHYKITPIICLDDASMHFSNMLHMLDIKLYASLLAETATVRSAITGFLMTAPKRAHVCKFLRDYDDFKGEVFIDSGAENFDRENWNRKVRFYQWHYYPDETKFRIHIPFQDKYSCYIPEPYYGWYIAKKRYFEIKHDIDVASSINKDARAVFIEYVDDLPEYPNQVDLKSIVRKWTIETEKKEKETKIDMIKKKLREENLKKKLAKIIEERELIDDTGNSTP